MPETTPPPTPQEPRSFYDGLLDCVHCGFCLDACPTYAETGNAGNHQRKKKRLEMPVAFPAFSFALERSR